ncbi:Vesicle transport protein GOT1B [Liparis tanakae]|uniref:Vesicle transport protein GOT1B n=1 Tax=Liparis tanakae TaxID=230148 RepID=A0A4Z2FVT2_9TELE|nr:Vesicle transport protein GOT1B [Liparis tanakae]
MQILFVAGLAFVIGLERTFRFFFQKHKMKATGFFLGGVFVVLIGWPIIGVVLEVYGFFLLFRGFFPVVVGFIRRIPVLGSFLNLPFISGVYIISLPVYVSSLFYHICVDHVEQQTDPAQVLPVQQVGQPLGPVPLDDALPHGLLAEAEHEVGQLVAGLLRRAAPPVHDVNTWRESSTQRDTGTLSLNTAGLLAS